MRNRGWLSCVILVSVAGCPTTPEPMLDAGAREAGPPCAVDSDCDDGRFCNGEEACMPTSADADERGCAPAAPPCLESQRCSEEEGRCLSSCAIAPDADADGFDSVTCGGADCDDADPTRNPGETEICDAADVDEDCNGTTFGGRDADGDMHVDGACCNDDGGTMRCGTDCNDNRRDAHPGATEACERIDNDCDGSVDEMLTVMAWPDEDFDLHGAMDDSRREEVCPGAPGFSVVSDDCDDMDPIQHGAQLEICDGVDNDCDTRIDEAPVSIAWYPDEDGDLFGAPGGTVVVSCTPVEGFSTRSSDCDDSDARVHPGARELCNGVDDDCNGTADATTTPGDTEDDDGDGYADVSCGGNDCADASADVHPGAPELCNMRDDDCDTIVDGATAMAMWHLDLDRDGFGDRASPPITSCEPQAGRVPNGDDCDDADASVRPGVADPCDPGTARIDQDCDGRVDEGGIRFAFYTDADDDGFGTGTPMFECRARAGIVGVPGDCADTEQTIHPGRPEQCDGADEDCDTTIDEDSDRSWYLDGDGDGHGTGTPIVACMASGRVAVGDDCDDLDGDAYPGNVEVCDGRDEDCDTRFDEASADCMGLPFSTGTCTAGACALTCDAGHGDCDATVANGCEVDTRRNAGHCGACAMACGAADTCGRATLGVCDRSPIVAFEGTYRSVIGIRATGGTVAWGDSATAGVTSLGGDAFAPAATSLPSVVDVAIATGTGCAATAAGRVLCWGVGTNGERGDGSRTNGPGASEARGITDAVDVAVGNGHACAVHADGRLSCWGTNNNGELGLGTASTVDELLPVVVPGIGDAVEVAAMYNTTCVRRGTPGAYYVTCFGANANGNCGLGLTGAPVLTPGASVVGVPPDALEFSHGFADGLCVRTSDGRALCWGTNYANYGLGVGGTTSTVPSATPIPGMSQVLDVSLSTHGGCLVRGPATGGEVWCWGNQSGVGLRWIDGVTASDVYMPLRAGIAGSLVNDAIAVVAGDQRWCASRATGAVVCMGNDVDGGLGDGAPALNQMAAVAVLGLP